MTIQQTVDIPASRRLTIEVPPEAPVGRTTLIFCDELLSLPKSKLTNFIGSLSLAKMEEVNDVLRIALGC